MRPIEKLNVEGPIRFFIEQDGQPESELKNGLCQLFESREDVAEAYLMRAAYGEDKEQHAVLAILIEGNRARSELAEQVSVEFKKVFAFHEHLDTFFPSVAQIVQIRAVCSPFYRRKG